MQEQAIFEFVSSYMFIEAEKQYDHMLCIIVKQVGQVSRDHHFVIQLQNGVKQAVYPKELTFVGFGTFDSITEQLR